MAEKELKKLNRQELLELLAEQTERADKLELELAGARKELADRGLSLAQCGTLAEAVLKLNGIFEAADASVAQYVENIKTMSAGQKAVCDRMEQQAKTRAAEIILAAEREAAKRKREADAHWENVNTRIRNLDKEYSWIRALLDAQKGEGK